MRLTSYSGLRNASLHTLAQDFALKLGENGQHAGQSSPAWGG